MKKLCVIIQCIITVLLCSAWTYPQEGINYPTIGKSNAFIRGAACNANKTTGCYGISTSSDSKNVLLYVYPSEYGAEFNPWFIVSYALLLQKDCYNSGNPTACSFLEDQLDYLVKAAKSPRQGMSVWPLYQGRSDALVQGGISVLFNRQHFYDGKSKWQTLRDSAGSAFDWSISKGGIAYGYNSGRYWYVAAGRNNSLFALNVMNKAMINLHDLCTSLGGEWCTRRDRGFNALNTIRKRNASVDDFNCPACAPAGTTGITNWSYHRISTETGKASCNYHYLNADTLYRLIARLKSSRNTENLKLWADKWKESYSQSVDQGVCPSKSWNG